jgi:hypothetical protein
VKKNFIPFCILLLFCGCSDTHIAVVPDSVAVGNDAAVDGAIQRDQWPQDAHRLDLGALPPDASKATEHICTVKGAGTALTCNWVQDCPGGPGMWRDCLQGKCIQCLNDNDCHFSPHLGGCNTTNNTCMMCSSDDHCFSGNGMTDFCDLKTGTCTRCEKDEDCGWASLGIKCDSAKGRCLRCVTDNDCKWGQEIGTDICASSIGSCFGCNASQDCLNLPKPGDQSWSCEPLP